MRVYVPSDVEAIHPYLKDELLVGTLENLWFRLDGDPQLTSEQTGYDHRATLLHYPAANEVSNPSQCTPQNTAILVGFLIGYGADIHARADIYCGGATEND